MITDDGSRTNPILTIVKRESGFVAGWFRTADPEADARDAAACAAECNRLVPSDPAQVVSWDTDAEWGRYLDQVVGPVYGPEPAPAEAEAGA